MVELERSLSHNFTMLHEAAPSVLFSCALFRIRTHLNSREGAFIPLRARFPMPGLDEVLESPWPSRHYLRSRISSFQKDLVELSIPRNGGNGYGMLDIGFAFMTM